MTNHIVIVGGGVVGLTQAALLSKNNFSVTLIEEKIPELQWENNALTARVSAIHAASCDVFAYLDLAELFKKSAALHEMEIWDHTRQAHLSFDSRDAHAMQMGYIIENRVMIKMLWEKLDQDRQVNLLCPQSPEQYDFSKTDLIIGADGAHSWVRKQMPIKIEQRPYQQKAIIAVIESEKPHHNKAIQKFLTTGPVALLPLADSHHTALVWSADNLISDDLVKKSELDFSTTLTHALDYKLGKLKIITPRSQFPLIMRHADEYASDHRVLVGDAAHTIHPLAGLGMNLGLMDAACLTQVLIDARAEKKPIGSLSTLRRYTRWRKAENAPVIHAMRTLQEIFAIDSNGFNTARTTALNWIDNCNIIKTTLMKIAMGKSHSSFSFLQN